MHLKWKIYYACSLYLLLWVIIICTIGVAAMMQERHNDTQLLPVILTLLVFVITVSKSVLSLKAISHYKHCTLQSKTEKVLFIITFALTALLALGLLLLSLLVIIPQDFLNHSTDYKVPGIDYFEMALDISFFVVTLTCVYLSIFDLILLKAIRRKYEDEMLNFGANIIDNS